MKAAEARGPEPITTEVLPLKDGTGRPATIRFHQPPRDARLSPVTLPDDWPEQIAAATRSGYERGLVDGERVLGEQLLQQRNEIIDLQNSAVAALQRALPEVLRQAEEGVVALAHEIACKLVAGIPVSREVVTAAVGEALRQAEDTSEITVLLHAEDLALLGGDPAASLGGEHAGKKLRFAASREVTRGGCLVQTRFGIIDNRRETKVEKLAESLGLGKERE
jgi:flagellar assembly protein FliH